MSKQVSNQSIINEARQLFDRIKIKEGDLLQKNIGVEKYAKSYTCMANQFVFIVDFVVGKITYTNGIEECLGYSKDEFTIALLMSYIHPDDQNLILTVVKTVFEELAHVNCNIDLSGLDFLFSYRIRKKDGTYLKILQQVCLKDSDKDGRILRTFDVCTDISSVKHSDLPIYQITGKNSEKLIEIIAKKLNTRKLFSPREKEILVYMCEGKNSTQISEKLNINAETVRTHKKRMYNKTGCNNSSEFISYVLRENLL